MNRLSAIAQDTRRQIVELIASNGELPVSEICRHFTISPPAISQHLKILRQAGVLKMKKDAQRRLYSLSQSGIEEVTVWLESVKNDWNQMIEPEGRRSAGRRRKTT